MNYLCEQKWEDQYAVKVEAVKDPAKQIAGDRWRNRSVNITDGQA